MAVFCVNRSSTKFKETAKRLNIDSNQLELIVHEYINSVGEANAFPSDDYIQSKVSGKQTVVTPSVFKVWQQFYSTPQTFNSREELDKAVVRAETIFDKSAIGIKINNDGSYVMNVKQPVNEEYEKRLQDILDNAPRNEEGKLLAPNGKVSNLTERQYAQVRTKEFKDWFGDWENDPNNASKVVDENSEPLIVYHGGARNINAFKLPNNKATISFDSTKNLKWAKREGYVISEEDLVRYNNGEEIEVTKPVGIYFAADEIVSRSYFGRRNIEDDGLYTRVYSEIKDTNPLNITRFDCISKVTQTTNTLEWEYGDNITKEKVSSIEIHLANKGKVYSLEKGDIKYENGVYQYRLKGLQPNTSYFGYVVFKTSSEDYRKFPINFTTDISNKKAPSKKKDSSLVGVSW